MTTMLIILSLLMVSRLSVDWFLFLRFILEHEHWFISRRTWVWKWPQWSEVKRSGEQFITTDLGLGPDKINSVQFSSVQIILHHFILFYFILFSFLHKSIGDNSSVFDRDLHNVYNYFLEEEHCYGGIKVFLIQLFLNDFISFLCIMKKYLYEQIEYLNIHFLDILFLRYWWSISSWRTFFFFSFREQSFILVENILKILLILRTLLQKRFKFDT